jgi:hypothetical protein
MSNNEMHNHVPPITLVLDSTQRTVAADAHAWCEIPVPPLPQTDGPFYMELVSVLFDALSVDGRMTFHCDLGQQSKFESQTGGPGTVVGTLAAQAVTGTFPRIYCHRRNPDTNVLIGARYAANNNIPTTGVGRFIMILQITPA